MPTITMQQLDWTTLKARDGNRNIRRENVDRLKASITRNGYWPGYPIVANTHGEILVGQHRWIACKELATEGKGVIPTVIQVDDDLPVRTLIDIEKSQKPWGSMDVLRALAFDGNATATTILTLCEHYDAEPRVVLHALGRDQNIRRVADLQLSPDEVSRAQRLLSEVRVFEAVLPRRQVYKAGPLMGAYVRMQKIPTFNFRRFRDRLNTYGKQSFVMCTNRDAQLKNLIAIYNYRTDKVDCLPMPL